jgi:hypothetical protein
MLDSLARRYGQRPSWLAGGDSADFQIDLLALAAGSQGEQEVIRQADEEGSRKEIHIRW